MVAAYCNTDDKTFPVCCMFYLTCVIVGREDGPHRPLLNGGIASVLTLDWGTFRTVFQLSTHRRKESMSGKTQTILTTSCCTHTPAVRPHQSVNIILFHLYFQVYNRSLHHTFSASQINRNICENSYNWGKCVYLLKITLSRLKMLNIWMGTMWTELCTLVTTDGIIT